METSPKKRQRQVGRKKATKAMTRLSSLKGEGEESTDVASSAAHSGVLTDRGFRDVRTLTEKMRILAWVCT
jgi:hypothetical protein